MSTPGQGGEGPRYDPYGQRGAQQGGQGQPGSYGSPPPYGQPGQYAYNPYAPAPYPATSGPGPVKRPGIMVLSLVLLVLSTLPFLFLGVVLLAVPADSAALKILIDGIGQAGATAEQVVTIIRIVGGVFAGTAAIYILFAALAFSGRNWARIATTVLTAGFVLLLIAGVVRTGGGDVTSLGLVLVVGALAVVGTLLLFQPKARDYYAARRG